jgi:hypothetical protein
MGTKFRQKPLVCDVYRGTKDPSLRIATLPGAGLPAHVKKKDWTLMSQQPNAQQLHTDVERDIGAQGYCFFQIVKGG